MDGGSFNKQRNFTYMACLGCHKTSRSPHPQVRMLKVYTETLSAFSQMYHPDGLNNPFLSQVCILENVSHYRNGGQSIYSKNRNGGWGASNAPGRALGPTHGRICWMIFSSAHHDLPILSARTTRLLLPHPHWHKHGYNYNTHTHTFTHITDINIYHLTLIICTHRKC